MLPVQLHRRQWCPEAEIMASISHALPLWKSPQWRAIKCWQTIHAAIARDQAVEAFPKGHSHVSSSIGTGWSSTRWAVTWWRIWHRGSNWHWKGWRSSPGPLPAAVQSGRAAFLPWAPSRPCVGGAGKRSCKRNRGEAGCSRRAGRIELQPRCNPCRRPCRQLARTPASATRAQPGFPLLTANSWGKATS